jgi:hypothetical protein
VESANNLWCGIVRPRFDVEGKNSWGRKDAPPADSLAGRKFVGAVEGVPQPY